MEIKLLFKPFFALFFLIAVSFSSYGQTASDYFITTWKTDNTGISNASSITIPIYTGFPSETYSYDVDWNNDGTFDALGVTGSITHDYVTAGTYQVAIRGTFPRIYFNFNGDRQKITSIDQWGTNIWSSMEGAFYGCTNLESTASDTPNLTNVTNMLNMFYGTSFNSDVSAWDVSNVNNMAYMFAYASAFNQDLSTWNMSNVSDISFMFYFANVFNGNISTWDVSNVSNFSGVFANASAFNGDISNWNVSNATTMIETFNGAILFNSDISSWDVSNVTNMRRMFLSALAFNQNISGWNVGNVTNMNLMFATATSFNQNLGGWNVGNVTDMSLMFYNASAFNEDLSGWNVSNVTNMANMFNGVTLSTDNYDALLNAWSTLTLKSGVNFTGGNSTYCSSETARTNIINNFGWTITDGGKDCVSVVTEYSTIQDGNWEDASTWLNGDIPPATIPDGTTVEIKHQVLLNSNTVVTNEGRINVNPDNAPVAAPGDYFNSYYQFQIYGTLNNNNILEVIPGPSQVLSYYVINYYGTLNNTGSIIVNAFDEGPQGRVRFSGSGTLNNESGGLIEIYDVVQFGGTVNNKLGATYRQYASVQGQTFGEFNNAGLFDIVGGSFSPRNGGELNNLATGVIENNASIYLGFYVGNLNNEGVLNNRANAKLFINGEEAYYDGTLNSPNGNILNDGKIIGIGSFITSANTLSGSGVIYPYNALPYNYPGYSSIQPGILDVTGNLTNFGGLNYALQNTTIGEGYGSVSVTGLTDISGTTLEVTIQLDAITNQVGDEYILLESTEGVTGQFSTTTLPTLDNNLKFEVNYESNRVILKVVSIIIDTDGDGINDDVDNCPDIANVDQADNDADGIGDVCDPDDDNDGVLDTDDNCPFTANVDQADNDGDGLGDICDDDDDNDGILDINDNCPLTANADQADNDADGIGDVCDPDDDNDGVLDVDDNCALIANSDQLDSDGDGMGDVCDNCPLDPENDIDGDGVCGDIDNCPAEPNGDQADSDCDGVGDVCDICPGGDDSVDNNNDGIPDCSQLLAYEDYSDEWKCGKKKQKKILIVHIPPGHPENAHEICISYNALPAHIANHGDFIGTFKSCDNSKEKSAIIIENDIELYDSFNVNVYPNPASSEFNLKVSTDNKVDKVDVQVMDIMGKQVHFNTFDSNKLYKFGESLETGIYFIRITQGEYSKNLKVIKKLN